VRKSCKLASISHFSPDYSKNTTPFSLFKLENLPNFTTLCIKIAKLHRLWILKPKYDQQFNESILLGTRKEKKIKGDIKSKVQNREATR